MFIVIFDEFFFRISYVEKKKFNFMLYLYYRLYKLETRKWKKMSHLHQLQQNCLWWHREVNLQQNHDARLRMVVNYCDKRMSFAC